MVERPLGLISVDELVRVLPDLIADALRERDTRPPPSSQATLTKSTGVVVDADGTTAEVQLDEDEPGVLSFVQLANAVSPGDRVVVLLSPGGSAIAIGNGNAQAQAQDANPANRDYLQAFAATPSGLTTATIEHLDWTVDAPHTSGTDISIATNISSVDAPLINVDGVYAINCLVGASADTGGDTFNNYIALLDVEPNSGDRDAALMTDSYYPGFDGGGTRHYGNSALNWVGFLPAGAFIDVTLDMRGGGAGTWGVLYGAVQIDRIG